MVVTGADGEPVAWEPAEGGSQRGGLGSRGVVRIPDDRTDVELRFDVEMVVLDMVLPGNRAGTVLKEIRTRWPLTRCIVLADDVQQQQESEAAGADAVLIKGFPAVKLVATIEGLLSQEDKGGAYAE